MRRALPWVLVGLGAVLIETGVALFAAANRGPARADFGWSAYMPLQPTRDPHDAFTFVDTATVWWTQQHLLALGLVVLGLLALVGVGSWLLGRRAGRRAASRA
jgi:hypothetical protein